MELYKLDSLLRRDQVIDEYESLIWTERFSSAGEFELDVRSTPNNRALFEPETWMALNESFRCMKVEELEDTYDSEGRSILKVKGPSIELPVLGNRVAFNVKDDLVTNPKWVITDTPGDVARKVFQDVCVTGILDTSDILPFITNTAVFPDDTIPEPTDNITVEIDPDTVYNVIKQICEPYDLGFRLIRNYDLSQLVFNVYAGSDRTSQQEDLPPVIFSPDLNNMTGTRRLDITTGIKNIAYVYSNLGFQEVVATDVDPDVLGFERHVLVVKMDDFDEGTPGGTVTAMMQQKGREELAKHRRFVGFDGEVSQRNQYRYGVDYHLGDLVEAHGSGGNSSILRVTEQTFVSDKEGERSYPTLSMYSNVSPGSWLAQTTQVWFDYDDDLTTYWASMP